jgi:putative endonuclease
MLGPGSFYVYILENADTGEYYTGSTDNLERRLDEHFHGKSKYTRNKGAWKLIYSESFDSRKRAVRRELQIKRMKSRKYIESLTKKHVISGD